MRLKETEKNIIKSCANEIFGNSEVFLFGSRMYDYKKGGDIDLYIVSDNEIKKSDEISFLALLERKGVQRKVDLIVKSKNKKPPFAIKGIKL